MAESARTPEDFCEREVERMLKNSQTKIIAPIITLGLLRDHIDVGKTDFSDSEIRKAYIRAIGILKRFLGHDLHLGAKYYDAYGSRMSRYGVLRSIAHLRYELQEPYRSNAAILCDWIPERIRKHIDDRLGIIPSLGSSSRRAAIAEDRKAFLGVVQDQIAKTPANFEIFTFAVLKVHLQKFACRIYRDTRASAHDKGVDISTNFGVVYQIKKLRIVTKTAAKKLYSELKANFDSERLQDGNVIVVVNDISKEVRDYLIDMKVQSIHREDLLSLVSNFADSEDRQKVLRIVFEEFRREYSGETIEP